MQANNAQKMREALEAVNDAIALGLIGAVGNYPNEEMRSKVEDITDKIDAVLSAPRRQCDVGTAEEQYDRFCAFCASKGNCDACDLCESKGFLCDFVWAQMPYEAQEGGAE